MKPAELVVLAADRQCQAVVEEILGRPQALGIRPTPFQVRHHPRHDPGARQDGPEILAQAVGPDARGLLILDWEGSGANGTAEELQAELNSRLQRRLGDRAAAIVLNPELEEWLVGATSALKKLGGPDASSPTDWWRSRGHWPEGHVKPERPKDALHDWLRRCDERVHSSVYRQIAAKASLRPRCAGASWPRFREILQSWFPPDP